MRAISAAIILQNEYQSKQAPVDGRAKARLLPTTCAWAVLWVETGPGQAFACF